jgi:hypothetical protein
LGLDGSEVCRGNFPLPTLQHKLQPLTLLLHRGRGFFSIRGLRPCDYSPEDNIIIFLGISSYVAEKKGKQDDEGNLFGLYNTCASNNLSAKRPISAHTRGQEIKNSSKRPTDKGFKPGIGRAIAAISIKFGV